MSSSISRNIATMQQAFDALNRRDIDACVDLMTEDFIINIAEMQHPKRGVAAWRKNISILLAAFPDIKVHIEDIFSVEDKLAVRIRLTGTHKGEFLGIKATGRQIDYKSHEIYRFEEGKLAEEWICSDMLTLLMQTGVLSKKNILALWLSQFRFWFGIAVGGLVGSIGTTAIYFFTKIAH